jgi:tRNA pseudouridine55 synthase
VPIEALREAAASDDSAAALAELILPVETALADLHEIAVDRVEAGRLMRGQAIILRGRDMPPLGETVYATAGGRLLALGEVDRGSFVPRRVFNLPGRPRGPDPQGEA